MKPQEIEDLSFEIIADEAGDHGFNEMEWPVVRRMIHTSADFEYIKTIRFNQDAVAKGIEAIRSGCNEPNTPCLSGYCSGKHRG